MTTEVDAGRALDVLVATQIIGWQPCDKSVLSWTISGLMNAWDCPEHGHNGCAPEDRLPMYSTDIAAAWLVIERLRELGLRPVLMPDWGKQWQVVVYQKSEYVCQTKWLDSLPHAICLAALAADAVRADAKRP